MNVLHIILTSLVSILTAFYYFATRKFDYWKKRNVPFVKPTPFFGNYSNYIRLKNIMGIDAQTVCKTFPKEPYVGAFFGTEPALIVQDPELIRLITVKDFYYFNGRDVSDYTDRETNTGNLFFTHGDRWKVIRHNLTPLFTSSKIRKMYPLIQKCAYTFESLLDREWNKSKVLDMRALISRYTMDCIGACGFGVDANVMGNDSENVFSMIGNSIFLMTNARGWSVISRLIWPNIFYGLGFRVFPKMVTDFFHNLITGVFKERNYEPSSRNDFVDMLLTLKKSEYIESPSLKDKNKTVTLKVDDEFLSANCVVFFAAGYETSAITSSHVLYELAKNQEAQSRAIAEVDAYLRKNDNKLIYETCISEMPYIDACIDEVMRMYPALNVLTREVMEDYTLPTGLRLEKNLRIHIPVYHLHHNPEYFPEPEKFRPERFLPEEKRSISPYTYLPFGEGLRICSGKYTYLV